MITIKNIEIQERSITKIFFSRAKSKTEDIDIIKSLEFWEACNNIKNLPDEIKMNY